ncbi:dihydrofolate reductase [Clostridium aciditolerans]|uniref:Dihydrofolate reductase n=1 Tax=Clostridium aciditolerans TaxID=339861 RepID=A0A934I0H0_9CLOT|nr:dihydrofolate reductase [Clostridium aciditolerans]MBI6875494.1 dihydrofolate reductase [Clostridium aciditolerans]
MLSFVVAISNNNVIGLDNKIPWYLPDDLKKFKEITTGKTKTMIMGRKTFESLPQILPDRHHVVLTRDKNYKVDDNRVTIVNNEEDLKKYIKDEKEYFVIGGEEIFSLLFPYTNKMYITEIDADIQGDTFFPKYDEKDWKVIELKKCKIDEDNKYEHLFKTLERK